MDRLLRRMDTLIRRGSLVHILWLGSLSASAITLIGWSHHSPDEQSGQPVSTIHFQLSDSQDATTTERRQDRTGSSRESRSSSTSSEGKNEYLRQVLNRIEAHKRYPLREKQDNIEGSVQVHFRISSSGHLLQVNVAGPSPVSAFNVEAMSCIKRAAPFPAFPEDMDQDSVALTIRMDFKIR